MKNQCRLDCTAALAEAKIDETLNESSDVPTVPYNMEQSQSVSV